MTYPKPYSIYLRATVGIQYPKKWLREAHLSFLTRVKLSSHLEAEVAQSLSSGSSADLQAD